MPELRSHAGRHYAVQFHYALPDDAWHVELSEAVSAPDSWADFPGSAEQLPGAALLVAVIPDEDPDREPTTFVLPKAVTFRTRSCAGSWNAWPWRLIVAASRSSGEPPTTGSEPPSRPVDESTRYDKTVTHGDPVRGKAYRNTPTWMECSQRFLNLNVYC